MITTHHPRANEPAKLPTSPTSTTSLRASSFPRTISHACFAPQGDAASPVWRPLRRCAAVLAGLSADAYAEPFLEPVNIADVSSEDTACLRESSASSGSIIALPSVLSYVVNSLASSDHRLPTETGAGLFGVRGGAHGPGHGAESAAGGQVQRRGGLLAGRAADLGQLQAVRGAAVLGDFFNFNACRGISTM